LGEGSAPSMRGSKTSFGIIVCMNEKLFDRQTQLLEAKSVKKIEAFCVLDHSGHFLCLQLSVGVWGDN